MPGGKPAGVPCVQLDAQLRCRLFGQPERPAVCRTLRPEPAMCGGSRGEALAWLARLERATAPARVVGAGGGDEPQRERLPATFSANSNSNW
jgi:hypothetical protein